MLDMYSILVSKISKIGLPVHSDCCRRDMWVPYSTYKMWQTLLGNTTKQSRNRAILAETYCSVVCQKLAQLSDDLQRVYKKVRLPCPLHPSM